MLSAFARQSSRCSGSCGSGCWMERDASGRCYCYCGDSGYAGRGYGQGYGRGSYANLGAARGSKVRILRGALGATTDMLPTIAVFASAAALGFAAGRFAKRR